MRHLADGTWPAASRTGLRRGGSVAYLQTAQEARDGIARRVDVLVALYPEAAEVLDRAGVDYLEPLDFFDAPSFERWGREHCLRQADWVAAMDRRLSERLSAFRDEGFAPFRIFAHSLCWFSESLLWVAHILERSLVTLEPRQVWITPVLAARAGVWPCLPLPPWATKPALKILDLAGNPPRPRPDLFFRESVYSLVLPLLCAQHGIEVCAGQAALRPLSGDLPLRMVPKKSGQQARGAWMFTYNLYELPPLADLCKAEGTPVLFAEQVVDLEPGRLPSPSWRRRVRKALAGACLSECGKARPTYESWFGDLGPALAPVIDGRMEYMATCIVPALWEDYRTARALLNVIRPEVVIGATCGMPFEYSFLPAARSLHIPTVQYIHGWAMRDFPFSWNQVASADHYLVWEDPERASEGSVDVRQHATAVGSARLEALARRDREDEIARMRSRETDGTRPRCLFIANVIGRNRRNLRSEMDPVWHYHFQRRLLEIFSHYPDIDFFWRPYLPWGFDPRTLVPELPPNIKPALRTPASELIWTADLILLDTISSAFVEAALTRTPIMALLRFPEIEIDPADLPLIRKRATIHHETESFLADIAKTLARREFAPLARPDDSFLLDKNIHPGGGRAARRAVDAIRDHLRHAARLKPND